MGVSTGGQNAAGGELGANNQDPLLPFEHDFDEGYVLYKYRFFNLALFCFTSMLNQICWISMQPVADAVANAYDIDAAMVNTISLVYMGCYLFVNFPSNYIIDTYGCKVGVSKLQLER